MREFVRIVVLTLLLFLASVGGAEAEWKVATSERESAANESGEHWRTVAENDETSERVTLHFAIFERRRATLRVIDQAGTPRQDLAEVMTQRHCLAGVNGGYFDPSDAPVGLLVSDGHLIAPLQKARLLSGVLVATAAQVDIVRAARFSRSERIKAAVQCGPFLVERAQPVPRLNDSRLARRTFAAVDGEGRGALGVCSDISLAQFSKILCLTKVAGEMKIVRALNLDGGSSSAFWFAVKESAFSIPEQKTVRDFVAIVPRPDR